MILFSKQLLRYLRHGVVVFSCLYSMSALALDLPSQTLRYSVDYQGKDAGVLEVIITRNESGYFVQSISHLSLLASMFLKPITIEANFKMVDGKPLLLDGRELLTKSGKVKRHFEIDHDKQVISFSGGEPLSYQMGTALDADSFPLALVFSDLNKIAGKSVLSLSAKRGRAYVFEEPVIETVTVPAGEFESVRVLAVRPDEPERTYSVWLRKKGTPIPVKIITGKKNKQTTLVLIENE